jgi:hypothetical protein
MFVGCLPLTRRCVVDELRALIAKWRAEAREIDCAKYKNERSKALASVAASVRIDCAAALQVKLDAQPVPAEGAQARAYELATETEVEIAHMIGELNSGKYRIPMVKLLNAKFLAATRPATAAPAEPGFINKGASCDAQGNVHEYPLGVSALSAPPSTPASREPK